MVQTARRVQSENSSENKTALAKALAQRIFGHLPVRSIGTSHAFDHDGENTIKVTVEFFRIERQFDLNELVPLEGQLRDEMWQSGERAFVHIKHVFDPAQGFAKIK